MRVTNVLTVGKALVGGHSWLATVDFMAPPTSPMGVANVDKVLVLVPSLLNIDGSTSLLTSRTTAGTVG